MILWKWLNQVGGYMVELGTVPLDHGDTALAPSGLWMRPRFW